MRQNYESSNYESFMTKQDYPKMYVAELLEMYATARDYLWGVIPVQGGTNDPALAEKMIEITNELETRIFGKGK